MNTQRQGRTHDSFSSFELDGKKRVVKLSVMLQKPDRSIGSGQRPTFWMACVPRAYEVHEPPIWKNLSADPSSALALVSASSLYPLSLEHLCFTHEGMHLGVVSLNVSS